ncbi:MAG: phosphoglucosamine mutase, partial [Candidatus Eremiobacteraeota bacterium]|nr:phosphoglucosamine mutase [Candidatus Eremiobacteraeota bacterium]
AFDGDGDRAIFVDAAGEVVNGDAVLFMCARQLQREGRLKGQAIVATVMSNIGFERALRAAGIELVRAAVGDRYVLEAMRAGGYCLGGEQSGHVVDFRYNTTGDGPRTAVTLLGIVAAQKTTLHDLVADVVYAPQLLVNVRTARRDIVEQPSVREAIRAAEASLGESGRLLVRPSGTEPLIRVMAEGDDAELIEKTVCSLVRQIEQEVERLVSI